jgi:hypothetical protein
VTINTLVIHDDKGEENLHRYHEDRFHAEFLIRHKLNFLDEVPAEPCDRPARKSEIEAAELFSGIQKPL